jgi:hypothetical protein
LPKGGIWYFHVLCEPKAHDGFSGFIPNAFRIEPRMSENTMSAISLKIYKLNRLEKWDLKKKLF